MIAVSCLVCKREIGLKGFYAHYQSKHERDVRYQHKVQLCSCDACGKNFTTASGLRGHKRRSHEQRERQSEYAKQALAGRLKANSIGVGLYKHTEETKQRLSEIACTRLAKHSKYSKNTLYKGSILESSYEVLCAQILDNLVVKWEKVRRGYEWDDNGKTRRYIPDFYLPEFNVFLDPKNDYLAIQDVRKIESACELNNIVVFVLTKEKLTEDYISRLLRAIAHGEQGPL